MSTPKKEARLHIHALLGFPIMTIHAKLYNYWSMLLAEAAEQNEGQVTKYAIVCKTRLVNKISFKKEASL